MPNKFTKHLVTSSVFFAFLCYARPAHAEFEGLFACFLLSIFQIAFLGLGTIAYIILFLSKNYQSKKTVFITQFIILGFSVTFFFNFFANYFIMKDWWVGLIFVSLIAGLLALPLWQLCHGELAILKNYWVSPRFKVLTGIIFIVWCAIFIHISYHFLSGHHT